MVADGGVDIAAGRLLVSRNEHGTWWEGRELDLTPRQFDILSLLASQPGRSFSRVEIWEHCWGLADFPQSNAIDAHVRRIRGKVPEGLRRCIKSAYGVGYRFLPYGWQVTNVTEEELVFPEEVAQAASQLTAAV
jgi:DNA-binding response OmpR family regulator